MADEALFAMVAGSCTGTELSEFLAQFPLDQDSMHFLINRRDQDRYTPLHRAVFTRNFDCVKVLCQYGADVNIKCHGTPVLHLALNTAVLPGSRDFGMALFRLLLEKEADVLAKDDQLGNILHVAAELGLAEALEMVSQLSTGYEIDCKDRAGMRPLHRAAQRDKAEIAGKLLEMGALPNSQTSYGSTPLHVAGQCASTKVWAALIKAGANSGVRDCWQRTPLELAALHGWEVDTGDESLLQPTVRLTDQNTMKYPTVIVTHPYCRQHYTCPPSETGQDVPPENTRRLHVIIDEQEGCLKSADLLPKLRWMPDCRKAAMSDVLRVHEWSYIRRIQGHCEQIAHDPEAYNGISNLDGDTTLSRLTFEAALRGAGGVCEGVDQVMNGQSRNAFVPVRPPGHHAGPRGLTKGEEGGPDSHGFCFLNNISIGAAYAMNKYREKIKRVAIIDFDVHHGNGTEETVKWLRPGLDSEEYFNNSTFGTQYVPRYKPWYGEDDANNVLFVSVHGFGPRERGLEHLLPAGAFYPGSGATQYPVLPPKVPTVGKSPTGSGKGLTLSGINRSRSIGSLQESEGTDGSDGQGAAGGEEVGEEKGERGAGIKTEEEQQGEEEEEDEDDDEDFGMGMAVDDTFDTGDGIPHRKERSFISSKMRGMQTLYTDMSAYTNTGKPEESLILDVGCSLPASNEVTSGEYRHQWRNYFRQQVFPRLEEFAPDMIFISAGFDAHRKDGINSGYIALVEEDFDWVTNGLIRVSNSCCEGRVVSALEGGYQIGGEFCSSFAKSVKTHVASLAAGAKTNMPYSVEDGVREMEVEKALLDEAAERRHQKQLQIQRQEELAREARRLAEEAAAAAAEQQHEADPGSAAGSGSATEGGGEGVDMATENGDVATSAIVAEHDTGNGDDEGNGRKRRRASANVDYVALDKELEAKGGAPSME